MTHTEQMQVTDEMIIEWDVPIEMDDGLLLNFGVPLTGSGPFQHNDPVDRPADIFGGHTTVHTGGEIAS